MNMQILRRTVTPMLAVSLIFGCQILRNEKPLEKAGTLAVTFTTTSPGGTRNRDPKNCHAVWIEDSKGRFVKTLGRWAKKRQNDLPQWRAADGGDEKNGG